MRMSTRFLKLKVFACVLKKRHCRKLLFIFVFFFQQKKLVRLFILKEVKPSPDSKIIKLLIFVKALLPNKVKSYQIKVNLIYNIIY